SHQDRDLTFASEADPDHELIWALDLRHLFGRAIRLYHERAEVTPATFARRRLLIENATDRLVFDRYVAPKTEAARLQQRYRAHRDRLYAIVQHDDVEPTNNSSERDLRPSVATARSSAASAPPGAPSPRPSARRSSPPPASRAGTS